MRIMYWNAPLWLLNWPFKSCSICFIKLCVCPYSVYRYLQLVCVPAGLFALPVCSGHLYLFITFGLKLSTSEKKIITLGCLGASVGWNSLSVSLLLFRWCVSLVVNIWILCFEPVFQRKNLSSRGVETTDTNSFWQDTYCFFCNSRLVVMHFFRIPFLWKMFWM